MFLERWVNGQVGKLPVEKCVCVKNTGRKTYFDFLDQFFCFVIFYGPVWSIQIHKREKEMKIYRSQNVNFFYPSEQKKNIFCVISSFPFFIFRCNVRNNYFMARRRTFNFFIVLFIYSLKFAKAKEEKHFFFFTLKVMWKSDLFSTEFLFYTHRYILHGWFILLLKCTDFKVILFFLLTKY